MTDVTTFISATPFETSFLGDLVVQVQNTPHGLRTIHYHEKKLDGTLTPPIRDELCEYIDSLITDQKSPDPLFTLYLRFVEVNHGKLH